MTFKLALLVTTLILSHTASAKTKDESFSHRNELIEKALELSHADVSHLALHNQIIAWAMKKNIDVVHPADNRIDWRLVKVN